MTAKQMTTDQPLIPHFCELTDFYRAVGFGQTPVFSDFDLLDFAASMDVGVTFMPPFRKDWYQVVLKLNPAKPVWLNHQAHAPTQPVLLVNSPNHVYSWQLDTDLRGFILFFKTDFLPAIPVIEQEFPFFDLTASNLITVSETDLEPITAHFRQLRSTLTDPAPYRRATLQALLTALLYRCKSGWAVQEEVRQTQPRAATTVARFQQLVHTFYLEKRTVAAYADLLSLTPNHLNELVRTATGRTARHFIVARVMTEAKNLLRHTDLDISTIAHTLHFDEPTNFGKFFRQNAGQTPGQFRAGPTGLIR
jgi:AraC family transcriptional regulator, transcriptional activator of pobA